MATTYVTYTVNSGHVSTPEFSYAAISLLTSSTLNEIDQLVVKRNGTALTPTTDYTVNPALDIVTISATIAVGETILIERVTGVDNPLVTFVNNALIDKDNLNDAVQQLLFRLQELTNDSENTITLDTSDDCWDGQGKRACNFAVATASSDLVTLGQMNAAIDGSEPAEVLDGIHSSQTADGGTEYSLTEFPKTDVNKEKLLIAIDGVTQNPTTDYTYDLNDSSVPTVTFVVAPPTGSTIDFRTVPGIVTTTYGAATLDGSVIISNTLNGDRVIDNTLDGDAIIAGTLPVSAIEAAAGDDNRFIVVDAAGTPSLTTITHDDIENTGRVMPSTFTTNAITTGSGNVTVTNSSTTNAVFLILDVYSSGGATISIHPPSASSVDLSIVGADRNRNMSVFIPAQGSVQVNGTGITYRYTTQEV